MLIISEYVGMKKMTFFVSSTCWNWSEQPFTGHTAYTCILITQKNGKSECSYIVCIQCFNVTY